MAKVKNPYTTLLEDIRKFVRQLKYLHVREMWYYPKNNLDGSWSMRNLHERVVAADQLGYEVILVAEEKGLVVKYRAKQPRPHWNWE